MTVEGNRSIRSVADVARELGIAAWDKLTGKQVARILELAGQAKISELQLQKIIELSKSFAPLAASVLQTVQMASDKAGNAQQKLIANYSDTSLSALETLSALLKETRDEDNKVKVAQMIADLAKEELAGIERMNKSNNNLWAWVSAAVASAATVGAFALRIAK